MDNNNFVNDNANQNVQPAAEPVVQPAAEPVQPAPAPAVEPAPAPAAETVNTYSYTEPVTSTDEEKKDGINVPGLIGMIIGILGVIALVCCCCWAPYYVGCLPMALGLPALILGIVGAKKRPDKKGMAVAAIILGAVSLVGGLIYLGIAIVYTVLKIVNPGSVPSSTPINVEDIMDQLGL